MNKARFLFLLILAGIVAWLTVAGIGISRADEFGTPPGWWFFWVFGTMALVPLVMICQVIKETWDDLGD